MLYVYKPLISTHFLGKSRLARRKLKRRISWQLPAQETNQGENESLDVSAIDCVRFENKESRVLPNQTLSNQNSATPNQSLSNDNCDMPNQTSSIRIVLCQTKL